MTRLFLLDGTALAFRSHFAFARSGLTTADGAPTGATYGFTMVLRKLLETEKPDLVAVAFDTKEPTFRHEMFADYKATRERAPEDLLAQFDLIRDVVRAHGIALFERPGYEADDVIGTLAREGEEAGHEVLIVTGDKDFMQLVDDRVKLYNVFKKGEDVVVEDEAAVKAKFGGTPKQVVDVLAIMGDSSDNVPGVKGIGEKGAIKLIEDYGSIEGVLEHLGDLTPKMREKIEASRDMLDLSRRLVTIDTHVPLDPGLDAIGPATPDREKLSALYHKLQFRSLFEETERAGGGEDEVERDYRTVADLDGLAEMERELRSSARFSVDTETTSLDALQADLVGISFSDRPGRAWYVPFNATPPVDPEGAASLLERVRGLLTDSELERIGQNSKYDWLVFRGQGLELPPIDFDTLVASFTAAGTRRAHNLDSLSLHFFGIKKIPTKDLIGSGAKQITMAEVPVEQVAEYACEDADCTFRLADILAKELEDEGVTRLYYDLELPLVPVLERMEAEGIRLDTDLLEEYSKELQKDVEGIENTIHDLAGEVFNVNSTKALGQILFEKLRIQEQAGVKRVKKTKTGYSTDAATLEENYGDVEIVQRLFEYRELTKLKSTYVDALPRYVNPDTGRVHPSFSQTIAATGRLACSDPNLQNIPVRSEKGRRLRRAFVPRTEDEHGEWIFLAADYSQIELRIVAHLTGDEKLIESFEQGKDIHAATAAAVFDVMPELVTREMRSQAKVINFGLLYGMGPQRLARETGMTVPEAKKFIEKYFKSFPSVKGWMEKLLEQAREDGYVETIGGRKRWIPDLTSQNPRQRTFAENAAINTPMQGAAADIIKKAMIEVDERLRSSKLATRMLLQVHDELLF
ncbi:MAG: DNA polymerase I, partial [Planctomycetota bacterium]